MALWRKKTIWVRGEDAAAKLMKRQGCTILARNLRLSMGEIDLLCCEKKTGTTVLVEVKAREYAPDARAHTDPTANIGTKKQAKLRLLAHAIKKQSAYRDAPIRIDAVGVVFTKGQRKPTEIKHYRSAVSDV